MKSIVIIEAQKKVLKIWILLTVVLFLILIFQVFIGNKYGGEIVKVIGWFTQNIMPTMGILLSTLIYVSQHTEKFERRTIDLDYLKIVRLCTLIYFAIIYLFLLLQPQIYRMTGLSAIEVLLSSNLFLGIFQGIVNSIIGLLFFKIE